jgi:transposase InsO family protein
LNAYAERFVGSIKSECLSRLILFGEASLRRALSEYIAHYHLERNHQGVQNRLLTIAANDPSHGGEWMRRERLGGVLSYYHRLIA